VKSSVIGKRLIVEAWEKVRASNGAPGVDAVGIGLFAGQLRDNLFNGSPLDQGWSEVVCK